MGFEDIRSKEIKQRTVEGGPVKSLGFALIPHPVFVVPEE
jgi:hypothetical protein